MVSQKSYPSVGILTFTDDREEGLFSPKVESHLEEKQNEIKNFLKRKNIKVIDPLEEIRKENKVSYGIRSIDDIESVEKLFQKDKPECLIIGCWGWAPPMLIIETVRRLNLPFALYTENDPYFGGLSQLTATGSSLLEWSVNINAKKHERIFENRERLVDWIRGISAIMKLRESAAILWGGTYAVKMQQLQDDIPKLKSFLIRDILQEGQYVLIKRMENILKNKRENVKKFYDWILKNGAQIKFDNKKLTKKVLLKQLALVIAARERLKELKKENIRGVSIKCQPEIYKEYGLNACSLPAFLAFGEDPSGKCEIYPTVCEGDIKGLMTAMMLTNLVPDIPPAFGDLISVTNKYIEFANCGGGSIYWSCNSGNARKALSKLEIRANNHGISGAAFGYYGSASKKMTICRLTRVNGRYYMQLGLARELDAKATLSKDIKNLDGHLAGPWGKIVIDLGDINPDIFVRVIGANHLSGTLGDYIRPIKYACSYLDIDIVRLDSNEEMLNFYEKIKR